MITMSISLPASMQHWIEAQVEAGHYSNASDHVRDLIGRDQERAGQIASMQRLVDDARPNGLGNATTADKRVCTTLADFTDEDRAAIAASRAPVDAKAFNGEII